MISIMPSSKAGLLERASLFFIISLVILLSGCDQSTHEPMTLQGKTMGTTYSITLSKPEKDLTATALQSDIDQLLLSVNEQMSTYIDDSEISQFNQAPIGEWFAVSPDFIEVVSLSQTLSEQSQGQFDATIGPLIELWGFGRQAVSKVPSEAAIAEAKLKTGWRYLEIDSSSHRLKRNKPIALNLSAIAKGFGVDKIAQYLDSIGLEDYLVEIGGEIRVKGVNPQSKPWRLGIEKPTLNQQSAQQIVKLNNASIATSGDYRNYFEENGLRYSHTINPETGKPVRHNIASVTVIAPTAALADGYATAFNVMGLENALPLAEKQNLSAFFIIYDQNSETAYREVMTSDFDQYFVD